jgi:phytoene desaturase
MSPNPEQTGARPTADGAPVVVIGAGFGGLAAAIRLRAMGHPVRVLEAGPQAGGRARVFHREGFTFDAGPTVITAPYLIDELFSLVGRDRRDYVELLPVDPFYRVMFPDGATFDYVGEEERILSQIQALSPRDVDGYRRLAAHAERIFDVGYMKLADQPFDRLSDMLRAVPDMVRLESYRTVYGLVSKYIEDPRLRQVFTFQPLLVGGNPMETTSIYMLIHWLERKWGVFFPKGGTGALVTALTDLLAELDVEVRTEAPVERIEVKDGRAVAVVLESGERIPCRFVVSNADPSMVYTKMIAPEHRSKHSDRAVARKRQSMSLFVTYFGTDIPYADQAHHSIVLGPRYEGLLTDIFNKKVLADDFSLYLHAPTRSDPDLAPPGGEAFYVLSPVPNQLSGIDWAEAAPEYEQRILSHLEARVLPGLREHIVTCHSVDPRYFAGDLRSYQGAAFGIEPVLTQSAWFRYHNRSEDVDGLYFVGASTHPGAGVPGVLCGAKVMEKVVPLPVAALPLPSAARLVSARLPRVLPSVAK